MPRRTWNSSVPSAGPFPIPGVARFRTEGSGKDLKIVVEHDVCTVTADQLMEALRQLPSFYEGSFIPSLLET